MVEKTTTKKEDSKEESSDVFKVWADSFSSFSKSWEDTYLKIYKPLIKSTGEMSDKSAELFKNATPENYKKFYDDWMKTYNDSFGKVHSVPTQESVKKDLEKLLKSAEETNKLYGSWISELDANSKKTKEILESGADPTKYKECYEMWTKSYEKIFDDLLKLPTLKSTKELFQNCTGTPDIYHESFVQSVKQWKELYTKLYGPLNDSMLKLSEKITLISRGSAGPDAYKEFYELWLEVSEKFSGNQLVSAQPSKVMFEKFVQDTDIYLNMYKSWIEALEKMSKKAQEVYSQTGDPHKYAEFSNLWMKTYARAFDSFFDDMPMFGPMKDVMEPVKSATKAYTDIFNNMCKVWTIPK